MRKFLLFYSCFFCNWLRCRRRKPYATPAKKPVTYNIIFPDNKQQPVSIKATKCKPLYYDEKLIRVVCYADGKWVWKKNDWE